VNCKPVVNKCDTICLMCVILDLIFLSFYCDYICRRFETGGSLGRRVKCRRVPQPRWVGARPSAKGGGEAAGDGRERGGNPTAFVFVPRPGRVRLQ
jgi:hypothetical protein